jgi:SWI/SNF-related matrix-associated actin-dependent regulator 1 of chromatin subfamily A
VLVVCPASVKSSWEKEIKKWTHLKYVIIDSKTKIADIPSDVQMWVINYDILRKHFDQLMKTRFDLCVADECHYVKSPTATRTKVLRQLAKTIPHVVLLSGTPLLSRPVEMFTLLNMIDPTTWSNYYTFTRQYCAGKQGRWGWDASGASNTEELHERIKKYFIRRKKEEVLSQLPPKNRIDVPVTFPADIATEYDLAENNLIAYLREYAGKQPAEIARAVQAEKLAQLNVLRQLCAFGKLPAAEEIIESVLEADEKILVFSSFVEPLNILKDKLKDKAVIITGKTKVEDRGDIVDKFQTDPNVKVFLGGVKSAGVGITLTAAQNVLFLDYAWNPADMQQAEDRVHRPGQTASSVNIYQLHVDDTIDGKLKGILESKQKIFDSVVEGIVPDETNDTIKEVMDDLLQRRGAKWAPMDLSNKS